MKILIETYEVKNTIWLSQMWKISQYDNLWKLVQIMVLANSAIMLQRYMKKNEKFVNSNEGHPLGC